MIKETFKTLKENPKALVLFFAYTVVLTAFILLMVFIIMPDFNSMHLVNELNFFSFLSKMIIFMLLTAVISLLSVFIIMPAFGQYVFEMCEGEVKTGWFKRGVKRSWWKLFVINLLISSATYFLFIPLGIITAILGRFLIIGIVMMLLMTFAVSSFYFIGFCAAIVEDNFSDALSNMFKIGIKYLWKIAVAFIVIYLPIYLFSFIYSLSSLNNGIESITNNLTGYSIMSVLISIYGVLSSLFLITYSMKNYLHEKLNLNPKSTNIVENAEPEGEI